jgi:hypothetical protein
VIVCAVLLLVVLIALHLYALTLLRHILRDMAALTNALGIIAPLVQRVHDRPIQGNAHGIKVTP